MKENFKVGIIGRGFVGSAVQFGFSPNVGCDAELRVYDKDISKSTHTLEETVNESDFIFLSVPTPSNVDGSMNIDILDKVLNDIQLINKRPGNIILIRSTVTPGTTTKLVETNFNTAEMIKYMNNCFFATKVSFMNEMKLIADASNVNWDMAVEGFVRDGRIGHSHLNVPGPDGRWGFGGSCFPKDIQAMISYGNELGVETNTLKGAWNTNLAVRPERDWEQLKGRSVVEE